MIWSQQVHQQYGGVVPELASRAMWIRWSVVKSVLEKAGIQKPDLVCATGGPGLVGAVIVGFTFAKSLALGFVCHYDGESFEGHLLSAL